MTTNTPERAFFRPAAATAASGAGGHACSDVPVLLPPRDYRDDLASLTDPCIITPIARVCIIGKRPPVTIDEPPLPTGNPPWLPQWACDFANVMCTRGQIPNRPADPPHNPLRPKEHEFGQCIKRANATLEYCKTLAGKASDEQVNQCFDGVIDAINDCYLIYGP